MLMKRTFYAMTMLMAFVISLLSCSKDTDAVSDDVSLGNNKLVIRTKAVSAGSSPMTVATPITIYIFNDNGKCLARKALASEEKTVEMKLEAGKYELYAIAGASSEDYTLPAAEEATPESMVVLNGDREHSDLMTAHSGVTLIDGEDADLTLSMQRRVLMLTSVNIANVPDDVTSISAKLSPLYENITLSGDYSGSQGSRTLTLARQSDGSSWTADCNLFLLPSVGNPSMTFTFKTTDGKTKTFTYESQKPLVANYKVSVNVNYIQLKEPILRCSINGVDWAGADVWTFDADERNFSVDGGGSQDGSVPDGSAPAAGTKYKGCYVLKSEKTDVGTRVTLIAPRGKNKIEFQENDQASIQTALDKAMPALVAEGIGNWRLPTLDELRYISENYNEVLGTKLVDLGLEQIGKQSLLYYLDSDGSIKCFGLANGVIFPPESKDGTYLRPFATLMFTE